MKKIYMPHFKTLSEGIPERFLGRCELQYETI